VCCGDEAALCTRCDVEINAANKLVSKHQRLPLEALSSAWRTRRFSVGTVFQESMVDMVASCGDGPEELGNRASVANSYISINSYYSVHNPNGRMGKKKGFPLYIALCSNHRICLLVATDYTDSNEL
jgi:hypothetical protein